MTHDEAMWHIRRACSIKSAAMAANTNDMAIRRALDIKPPLITFTQAIDFVNRYIDDGFNNLLRGITSCKNTTVVFWHDGKIKNDYEEVINSLWDIDIIGYYDCKITDRQLMDDLIAYIYDTTGDSML